MPKLSDKALFASIASVVSVAAGCGVLTYLRQRQKANAKHAIPSALLASSFSKELQVAVKLALQAGSNMVPYCDGKGTSAENDHDLEIETKGNPEDFATKVDVENETAITKGLLMNFPVHKVIGEETTGTGAIPKLTNDPTWILDPVDGTTNFASALPLTCVSIGFCVDSKPVMGVVFAPMTDELYLAVRGCGAYRNGVRITQRTDETKLKSAVVCFEIGYPREKAAIGKMLGAVQRILEHGCRTIRGLGSGVLDLCYVATGRLDVVYAGVAGEGWKPWDYCAGLVVAEESGCVVESIRGQKQGESFDLYSESIICAVGPSLLQEVRRKILSN